LVVYTRYEWGCLTKQEVVGNVTSEVSKDDGKGARLYEIKNPEDVVSRRELYLLFPAKAINGLSGKFVLKLWCIGDQPDQQAFLSVDWTSLSLKERHWVFMLKLEGKGYLRSEMMYSRNPEIREALFSCPESGNYTPYPIKFFYSYPLDGTLSIVPEMKMDPQWQSVNSKIEPLILHRAAAVDECQSFLGILDNKLGTRDGWLIWDYDKARPDTIREMAVSKRRRSFEVHLEEDNGRSFLIGQENFLPHIKQKLALKKATGELVGAEISLRASRE
jgi:hypothetical protein